MHPVDVIISLCDGKNVIRIEAKNSIFQFISPALSSLPPHSPSIICSCLRHGQWGNCSASFRVCSSILSPLDTSASVFSSKTVLPAAMLILMYSLQSPLSGACVCVYREILCNTWCACAKFWEHWSSPSSPADGHPVVLLVVTIVPAGCHHFLLVVTVVHAGCHQWPCWCSKAVSILVPPHMTSVSHILTCGLPWNHWPR